MDYRYYRGDGPKISSKWIKHIHLLRYIGTGMLLGGVILPWLMVLHMLESTYFWNFLSAILTVVGMMAVVIGVVFNNMIDRG
jgi:hypothetical protein